MKQKDDFIFGVQYYRAPTPEKKNWENDLRNIKENGFDHIKFWVQWRWAHRDENEFYFDDIDRLMDLAYENRLKVTINAIFDVAPKWFLDRYPDAKMILANGTAVESMAPGHRQIGGFPGTCYNHKKAFEERMKFLEKTVKRYKDHPAMHMWDVWNEPEQCGTYREAKAETLTCFCDNCREKFIDYLVEKYKNIEKLNAVWGKCYRDFNDIELPIEKMTISDFIDFREFHLDKMTKEANSRLEMVHSIDKEHSAYLHIVPNTSAIFNALTGVDDFDIAKKCDVFASTNFAKPIWSILTLSAGRGKTCYNVECHIGTGSMKIHQKQITLQDMTKELLPQIGMGIRGFMFWQYRPEILGLESPAWGCTKLDGTIGSVGEAATQFIDGLRPYISDIMESKLPKPEIAIWKGRKNEILSFCINNELLTFAKSVEAYVDAVYYNNYNCCVVNDEIVKNGLGEIKLLIMPSCYEADAALIKAVDSFVMNGGMLLCEAHLGGYNADTGRHSYNMPGLGADKLWNIKEEYTTSSYHLKNIVDGTKLDSKGFNDDVKKAIDAYGLSGGKYFDIKTTLGFAVTGSERFAYIEADNAEVVGTFNGIPCMVMKKHGKGTILYCGTNLSMGAEANAESFEKLVVKVAELSGVKRNRDTLVRGVHIDILSENMLIVYNSNDYAVSIELDRSFKGVFGMSKVENHKIEIAAESAELLVALND